MDILFKTDDYVFSYRIAGAVEKNGRYLLQRSPADGTYAFIGGHAAFGETNDQTLRREFMEELGTQIEVGKLSSVGEVFFPWGKRPCHQICLCYEVKLKDDAVPDDDVFRGFDELGGERIDLEFCWVKKEDLGGISSYPPQIAQHILSGSDEVLHYIYKE